MNPPQTTKLNDGLEVSQLTNLEYRLMGSGKSFLGLRREDTLAKLLFKELKDKTYIDLKAAHSARILERNKRFKQIVNSFDVSNTNYLMEIIDN